MEHKKPEIPEEDDNREPVIIENDYLLKSELTSRIALLFFFGWLISISLAPEPDPLNELYRKLALGTAIIGVIWTIATELRMLLGLIKNKLYIRIDKNEIEYEYIDGKGERKTDTLKKEDIISIKWALFPYKAKDSDIWITEITDKDDRRWAFLFSPLYLLVSSIYLIVFIVLNKFRVKKYLLIRFKDGLISIPDSRELSKTSDFKNKDEIKFEWRSLMNRYILQGGYYARQ